MGRHGLLAVLAIALCAHAGAPVHAQPSVPGVVRAFDVRAFGARGDGTTIDSDAINRAIDAAAAAGGGTVHFPAGTYASYSIRLKSHVALYLDHGATLLAAEPDTVRGRGYDAAEPGPGNAYQDFGHSHWHNSLIWGENVEYVSILGPGRIDGRGLIKGLEVGPNGEITDLNRAIPHMGNKAIALKDARNVLLRDVSIYRGGHFAVLATGVDNLTIDNVRIDTNRDGIDVDACRNVRISNVSVNSPNDDAIVLKSSYALGASRATEHVTITNALVSGYDMGSLLDGTFRRTVERAPDRDGPTGRIKLGTESNGAFRNITISNVVFDRSRGLALETVDGALLEDVTVTNVTMRDVSNAPFFFRLGSRMRGPAGTPVGALRRVTISNVVVTGADPRYASIITGIPGHRVEDVRFSNVRILYRGGLRMEDAASQPPALVNTFFRPPGGTGPREPFAVPERERMYPEPSMFGVLPAYGFYVRHASGIRMDGVEVGFMADDTRPAFVLDDVHDAEFRGVRARTAGGAASFVLRDVTDVRVLHSPPVADVHVPRATRRSF